MPWLKVSDKSPFHPMVLESASVDFSDPRLVNELFGFTARCAAAASGHLTDYIVHFGVAMQIAGPRGTELISAAVAAGYMSWTVVPDSHGGQTNALKIYEDHELFHMRLKDEVEWDRTRDQDRRSSIQAQIRQRDGDGCRYCGKSVQPNDNMTARGWELDHLTPGEKLRSPADGVVACRGCNARWKDAPRDEREKKLLDPPAQPLYSPYTAKILERHGLSMDRGKRLGSRPDQAAAGSKDTETAAHPIGDTAGRDSGVSSGPGIGPEDGRPHSQCGSDPADASAGQPDTPDPAGPTAPLEPQVPPGAPQWVTDGPEGVPETSGVPAVTTPPAAAPQAPVEHVEVSEHGTTRPEGVPALAGVPAGGSPRLVRPEPVASDHRPGSGPPDDKSHDGIGTAERDTPERVRADSERIPLGFRSESEQPSVRMPNECPVGAGRAGAGLDGTGQDGPGLVGPARQARPPVEGGRRKRRR